MSKLLYLILGYIILFIVLRSYVNKMNGIVKIKGKLYYLKSGSKGICTYGKNKICTVDGKSNCTNCYLNEEISKRNYIGKRVVFGLYASQILIGGVFLVSFI